MCLLKFSFLSIFVFLISSYSLISKRQYQSFFEIIFLDKMKSVEMTLFILCSSGFQSYMLLNRAEMLGIFMIMKVTSSNFHRQDTSSNSSTLLSFEQIQVFFDLETKFQAVEAQNAKTLQFNSRSRLKMIEDFVNAHNIKTSFLLIFCSSVWKFSH